LWLLAWIGFKQRSSWSLRHTRITGMSDWSSAYIPFLFLSLFIHLSVDGFWSVFGITVVFNLRNHDTLCLLLIFKHGWVSLTRVTWLISFSGYQDLTFQVPERL
jgi:hypothetical protein